jgi:hypothetical protein
MLLRTFSAIDSIESLNFYVSGTLISYSDKIRRRSGDCERVLASSGWLQRLGDANLYVICKSMCESMIARCGPVCASGSQIRSRWLHDIRDQLKKCKGYLLGWASCAAAQARVSTCKVPVISGCLSPRDPAQRLQRRFLAIMQLPYRASSHCRVSRASEHGVRIWPRSQTNSDSALRFDLALKLSSLQSFSKSHPGKAFAPAEL